MIKFFNLTIIVFTISLLSGCYSFSGTNLSPDVKTISVDVFPDEAGGPSKLSNFFTEKVKNYYQQNSRLTLIKNNGDLRVEGRITNYTLTPEAQSGNNTAALNRLTISVIVNFQNTKDDQASFQNQSFSQFELFEQTKTLSQVEDELIEKISDRIILDLFNKTVASW